MSDITSSVVTVLLAIIGVAVIAVLVSRNSNTSGLLTSGGNAFGAALSAATGPVSGSGFLNGFAGGGIL